jgi:hypothetical protein
MTQRIDFETLGIQTGLQGQREAEAALQYPTPGYPSRDQLLNTGHVAIVGTDHAAMLVVHDALAERGMSGYSVLSIPDEPAPAAWARPDSTHKDFHHAATVDAGRAVADVLNRARTKAEVAAAASGGSAPEKIDMPGRDVIDPDAIVAYREATQAGAYMDSVIVGAAAVVVTDVPSPKDDQLSRVEARIGWAKKLEKPVSRLRPGEPISPTHLDALATKVRHYEPSTEGKEYKFFLWDLLVTRHHELKLARASRKDGDGKSQGPAAGETTLVGTIKETFQRRFGRRPKEDEHKVDDTREHKAGRLLG